MRTPRYIRDNIHVCLLAKAYAAFVGAAIPRARGRLPSACGRRSRLASADPAGSTRCADRICRAGGAHQRRFRRCEGIGVTEAQAWDDFVQYYQSSV